MRERLVLALKLTLARPGWWAVAAAGFLARGGIVLFLAPLIALPNPVTVTLIFGVDSISGAGLPSQRFIVTIVVLALSALAAIAAMVVVAAWSDVALFERVTSEARPDEAEPGRPPRDAGGLPTVIWLQVLALLPGLVAFVLAVPAIRNAVISEFLFPSAPEVPFLARVIEGAQGPLLRVAVLLGAGEALATVVTRLYLGGRTGGSTAALYVGAMLRFVARPITSAVTWLVGWGVLVGALVLGLSAVELAWAQVRAALLDPALALPGAAAVSVPFVAIWIGALALAGIASTFRSTLWTLTVAADPAVRGVVRWRADAPA